MNFNKTNHSSLIGRASANRSEGPDISTLTAVALQDHMVRNLQVNLSLGDPFRPKKLPSYARPKPKKQIKAVVDTGRKNAASPGKRKDVGDNEEEYVLDPKPEKPTLAQKLGLVAAPRQPMTEAEWLVAKNRSAERQDFKQPCVICKEDLGTQEQVLLSCTHVFHRACLHAFERFTGKKTCPMCRKEQYQTRVVHEATKHYRHKCAVRIQAAWRGYVVKTWYNKLRETIPPKDPRLRKKFYEEKLSKITERMVASLDQNIDAFMTEIDQSLAASRDVFQHFDNASRLIGEEEWSQLSLKAMERGDKDCPICLTMLYNTHTTVVKGNRSLSSTSSRSSRKLPPIRSAPESTRKKAGFTVEKKVAVREVRQIVLLSCSHVFHLTCLLAFEEFAVGSRRFSCPVCRSCYQKHILKNPDSTNSCI